MTSTGLPEKVVREGVKPEGLQLGEVMSRGVAGGMGVSAGVGEGRRSGRRWRVRQERRET